MSKRVHWTYKGVTKTNGQWAKEYGMSPEALLRRMRLGWSIENALNTPLRSPNVYRYNGAWMTISELSKLNNTITKQEMYKRIAVKGWDPRCAVNVRNLNDNEREYEDIGFGRKRPEYCMYPKCEECPYPDCVA